MERPNLYGRKQIFTSETSFTEANIVKVVELTLAEHAFNAQDINFLYDVYKGKQTILDRTKKVRDDILNKVVVNNAYKIANFKTGFIFGKPVQYVSRGTCDLDGNETAETDETEESITDGAISTLNETLFAQSKESKDRELAQWLFIGGTGYRITLPVDTEKTVSKIPYETYVLDPRTTIVIYSNDFRKKPVLNISYAIYKTIENDTRITIGVYTESQFFTLTGTVDAMSNLAMSNLAIEKVERNALGMLPITEYIANPERMGSFEPVLSLIDEINVIESNAVDGIEQFIQYFIWFNNCEIDNDLYEQLLEKGIIQTKSEQGVQANIQVISAQLDQTQTNVLKSDLQKEMLSIAAVPESTASTGGNTGQALILADGWIMAESRAAAFEAIFKRSEKEFMSIVLKILQTNVNYKEKVAELHTSDVEIKFTRSQTDNALVKAQVMQILLQTGIHPLKAIEASGMFSDSQEVYQMSLPYLNKTENVSADTTNSAENGGGSTGDNQNTPQSEKSLMSNTKPNSSNDLRTIQSQLSELISGNGG